MLGGLATEYDAALDVLVVMSLRRRREYYEFRVKSLLYVEMSVGSQVAKRAVLAIIAKPTSPSESQALFHFWKTSVFLVLLDYRTNKLRTHATHAHHRAPSGPISGAPGIAGARCRAKLFRAG